MIASCGLVCDFLSLGLYTQHETYPFYIIADPILLYRINPMEVLHQMEFLIKLFAMVMVS